MKILLSPIVGTSFRPGASRHALENACNGAKLFLEPEETNEYDSNAVKVILPDFHTETEQHIGYIPAPTNKILKSHPYYSSNIAVLSIISTPGWKCSLTFSPSGQPLVQLQYDFEDTP